MSSLENVLAKKIALTGGPGVGKSSIIHQLKNLGYSVREEVFTKLFAEAQKEGRFNDQYLQSRKLVHELLSEQMELEKNVQGEKLIFLDRSRIDIWGFARSMRITPNQSDRVLLESGHYDLVFMIEPMPKEFYDQNSIRRQSYDESLEHHQINVEGTTDYLQMCGQDPDTHLIRVPFFHSGKQLSILERTRFILDRI